MERADSPQGLVLRKRLEPLATGEKAATIISFEEQTRGWLSVLRSARSLVQQIEAYRRLKQLLLNYCGMLVIDFDEKAAIEFQRLRKVPVRIGAMDLKIASIALAHDATLLTRSLGDFRKVNGLKVEDWTA